MSLYRLIAYKLKIFFSRIFRVKERKLVFRIASIAGLSVLFGLFIAGTSGFFAALRLITPGGELLAGLVVAITFHALLVLAFVLDIATTTNIFFLSSDLPLLMAAPIRTSRVFALKYLEALATGSLVSIFIAIPILLGYGIAFRAPFYFYVGMIVLLPVFLSIPVSIGTIAGFVIARFVRASRVKEILGLLGGAMGLAFWIGFQVMRPSLEDPGQISDFTGRLQAYAAGSGGAMSLLPSSHLASALSALRGARPLDAVGPVLILLATSLVLFGISVVTARRMYLAGWARVVPGGKKRKVRRGRSPIDAALFWAPKAERAIMGATARLFLRDPQQMMPVATISIMMAVFPFLTARRHGAEGFLAPVLFLAVAGLAFVGSMNLGMNGVAIDGSSFWRILCAPVTVKRKLAAKFMLPVTVFIPIGWALTLVFKGAGLVSWAFVSYAVWIVPGMSVVGSSVGVVIGMYFANWDWDIPKRMITVTGRLVMAGVLGGFFAGTAILMGAISSRGPESVLGGVMSGPLLVGAAIGILIALLVAYIFITLAARRLSRMEWKN
ncbi:MAG: hypothetical protein PVF95_01600 [bacterium]|jgi:hypothetical protein